MKKTNSLCSICGKQFYRKPSLIVNKETICCSRKCLSIRRRKLGEVVNFCERCGISFTTIGSMTRKYCSEECHRPPLIKTCPVCNKEFRSHPCEKKIFCGKLCSDKVRRGKVTKARGQHRPQIAGENSCHWRGGITKATDKARKCIELYEWRKSVFERDNYTCVKCGVRCGNGRAIILQADHIRPFSIFPELRFDINNGQTLCYECHKLKTRKDISIIRGCNPIIKYNYV